MNQENSTTWDTSLEIALRMEQRLELASPGAHWLTVCADRPTPPRREWCAHCQARIGGHDKRRPDKVSGRVLLGGLTPDRAGVLCLRCWEREYGTRRSD